MGSPAAPRILHLRGWSLPPGAPAVSMIPWGDVHMGEGSSICRRASWYHGSMVPYAATSCVNVVRRRSCPTRNSNSSRIQTGSSCGLVVIALRSKNQNKRSANIREYFPSAVFMGRFRQRTDFLKPCADPHVRSRYSGPSSPYSCSTSCALLEVSPTSSQPTACT